MPADLEERLLEQADDLVTGFLAMADVAIGERLFQNAVDMLEAVVYLRPGLIDAHLKLAETHQRLHDPAAAEASYERVVALDPGSAIAHVNLGEMAWRVHRDEPRAVAHLEAAARASGPVGARARASLGLLRRA